MMPRPLSCIYFPEEKRADLLASIGEIASDMTLIQLDNLYYVTKAIEFQHEAMSMDEAEFEVKMAKREKEIRKFCQEHLTIRYKKRIEKLEQLLAEVAPYVGDDMLALKIKGMIGGNNG